MMRACVAGGGIGGLAAAIALSRQGWWVTVLEQAAVFWEAGAGMLLTANGLSALAALGLETACRDAGAPVQLAGPRSVAGGAGAKPLIDMSGLPGAAGIHRRALHGVLLEVAQQVADLHAGSRVTEIDPGLPGAEPGIVLWIDAGGQHVGEFDLIVAADGANSTVRGLVAPDLASAPSGFLSLRAVVPGAGEEVHPVWWGPGVEFGSHPIGADRRYWYTYFPHPEGIAFADNLASARRMVDGWPDEVTDLVGRTGSAVLVRHDIPEMRGRASSWSSGRTVLIGDAAHAMQPTLNQGANLALEDATTLAACLPAGRNLGGGLAEYDRLRITRVTAIGRLAHWMGEQGAGCGGGRRQRLRNVRVRTARRIRNRLEEIHRWRAPSLLGRAFVTSGRGAEGFFGGRGQESVVDLMTAETIGLDADVAGRDDAVRALVALAARSGRIGDVEDVVSTALHREEVFPTALGNGIAVPHAKTDAVRAPVVAFLRSRRPVDWRSAAGEPASLIFFIAVPIAAAGDTHLRLLAQLSQALAVPQFRHGLEAASGAVDVLDLVSAQCREADR